MIKLGVNIDHIASLRQLRKGSCPEPVYAALVCLESGADSIVLHLREDKRHIKDRDLYLIREVISGKLNMEMSLDKGIVDIACKTRPDQSTLVPERRQELTTEGGLDVIKNSIRIGRAAEKLQKSGIEVSLFIDPQKKQVEEAWKLGIERIELHTGAYAGAKTALERQQCLRELKTASTYGHEKGMHIFAGHGLDYNNIHPILAIGCIEEVNIGYSIICRAVITGLANAVREMLEIVRGCP